MASEEDKAAFAEILAADAEANQRCFDCGEDTAGCVWAAVHHGVFLCLHCAGTHRGLGVHLTFARSTTMDTWFTWKPLAIQRFKIGGNAKAAEFFAAHHVPDAVPGQWRTYRERYRSDGAHMWWSYLDAAVEGREWKEADWVRPEHLQGDPEDEVADEDVFKEGDWCVYCPPDAEQHTGQILRVDRSKDVPSYVIQLRDGSRRGARHQWLKPYDGPQMSKQFAQFKGDAARAAAGAAQTATVLSGQAREKMAAATSRASEALKAAAQNDTMLALPEVDVSEVKFTHHTGVEVRFVAGSDHLVLSANGEDRPPTRIVRWDGRLLMLPDIEKCIVLPKDTEEMRSILAGLRCLATRANVDSNIGPEVPVGNEVLAHAKQSVAKAGAAVRDGWFTFVGAASAAAKKERECEDGEENASAREDQSPRTAAAKAGALVGVGWKNITTLAQNASTTLQTESREAGLQDAKASVSRAGQAGWDAIRSGWRTVVTETSGAPVPCPEVEQQGAHLLTDAGEELFLRADARDGLVSSSGAVFGNVRYSGGDAVDLLRVQGGEPVRAVLSADEAARELGVLKYLCRQCGTPHNIPDEVVVPSATARKVAEQSQKAKETLSVFGRSAQGALSRGWGSLMGAVSGAGGGHADPAAQQQQQHSGDAGDPPPAAAAAGGRQHDD
eukprot:TRINITY_DN1611_c0_g3_i1.p1 TRINITY_DN1611_c0_g3~~TRINITY_DN1611_c0_g3_i1.p1  ORF type:complete len:714 (+),score=106.82 TRINITY_DN1611_c0_g3_i1:137-2143(+)